MRIEDTPFLKGTRTAVCISGMPTNYQVGYFFHKTNLFDVLKPDIFVFSWYEEDVKELQPVFDLYDTPHVAADKNNQIVLKHKEYRGTSERYKPYPIFSFFKAIYYCNMLKSIHENVNGFKYDWVFRLRFDYALNRQFHVKHYDNKYMYFPHELTERKMVTDQFAFGSSQNMDVYSRMFLHLDEYYEDGITMVGEHMLSHHLEKNGLLDKVVGLDMNHPFHPTGGDAMVNSLIRKTNALRKDLEYDNLGEVVKIVKGE